MKDGLFDELRHALLGDLHVGNLHHGDRLPSIRQLARQRDLDHRLVRRVYRQLEEDGLVDIRGRSGVFVAEPPERPEIGTEQWMTRAITAAWGEEITAGELTRVLERMRGGRFRCACLESTTDHLEACCGELGEVFGIESVPVRLRSAGSGDALDGRNRLTGVLRDVDVAVTTAFHAPEVRPAAEEVGCPLIVASVNDKLRSAVWRRLEEGRLTVVVADPEYAARAHAYFSHHVECGSLRIVLASEREAATLQPCHDVLFTRAARRRLGLPERHLIEDAPFLSEATTEAIATVLVELAIRHMTEPPGGGSVAGVSRR